MDIGVWRRSRAMVLILALLLAIPPTQPAPTANAAGPVLSIAMSVITPQPVLAGNTVTWEISWQCSSVDATPCTGARIDVTKPALTNNGSAVGSPGFTTSATADGTGAHYLFIDPLPAGSSGTLQLLWESANLRTPDGTVLAPLATFSATNAASVQASAGAEIQATTHLAMTKRRLTTPEPPLDTDVTYEINVFDSNWPNYTNALPGSWSVVNAVVSDALPPGALFVSATSGGIYNATTNAVTWPAIPEVAVYEAAGHKFYVTLRYPSPPFTADDNPANTSDNITNQATVVGKPFGLLDGPDVTAQASLSHGFVTHPSVSGAYQKVSYSSGSRGAQEVYYILSWLNQSSVPADFVGTDRLPCQVDSPAGPLAPCANPGFRVTRMRVTAPVISGTVAVSYTTNLGNSGRISFSTHLVFKTPGINDDLPRSFGPGEFVSHFSITGQLAGGFDQGLELLGTIAPDFPDNPATETDLMTNCAQGSFNFGAFGASGPFERCASVSVVPAKPWYYHFKGGISLAGIAPTEVRTFILSAAPCGDLPWHPVFTDLLPANLRYVPGSQSLGPIAGVAPAFEVIDNYNDTGRQLLRWSWPGGQSTSVCSYIGPLFEVRVQPGTLPGTYTNYGHFFDAVFTNNNTPLTNTCIYDKEPDAEDLDGDGNTVEYRCRSGADYTVVETAAMVVTKEVRGSYDAAFKVPPAVGLVNPGNPAEYRITLQNTGNLPLTNLVAYDILPFVGDTGVSGTQLDTPRGSQWQPLLAGAVTPPAGGTVEYSLSTNPCRGEVIAQGGSLAAGPAGCVNDWTSAPTSFSAVRALRISLGSSVLAGGEGRSLVVPMTAPAGVQGTAWNTVALAGRRTGTSAWLLPTEPPKVGLTVAPPDLTIAKDDGRASVAPGAALTYTLTIHNAGSQTASGVIVSDTLPAYTSFVSASAGGSLAAGVVSWPAFDLAGGASTTRTVTIQLDPLLPAAVEAITNTARVADDGRGGPDPLPANNSAGDTDTISRTPAPACRVYLVQDSGNNDTQFLTLDLPGAHTQALGPLRPNLDAEALALHPATGALYATGKGKSGKDLLIVDRSSGAFTRVGRIGYRDVDSLAFRPTDLTLWAWARGKGLLKLNPATGAGALVFSSSKDIQDITWSADGSRLYAVSGKKLYSYDPVARKLTELASNLPGKTEGVALRPDGLLALGVDEATALYAYNIGTKQVVPGQAIDIRPYDDVEGIAWPAGCGVTTP